jgi:hypothetical protein
MTDLERELSELGALVALPGAPDLTAGVAARIAEGPPRRRLPLLTRRQLLAVALAVLVVAAAAVMAVPSARTAILRFFHVGSVTVERVQTLPEAEERPLVAGLGRPVSPDVATRRAGFRMRFPPLDDAVERIYVRDGLQAAILDVRGAGPVLLTEIRGNQFGLTKKLAGQGTRLEEVFVNGDFGLWIEGAPHVLLFQDRFGRIQDLRTRLAGDVLIWTHGGLTYRLEGPLTKAEALELARSIR